MHIHMTHTRPHVYGDEFVCWNLTKCYNVHPQYNQRRSSEGNCQNSMDELKATNIINIYLSVSIYQ